MIIRLRIFSIISLLGSAIEWILIRIVGNTTYIVFQWQLFYLQGDFYAGLRDFCPLHGGSKNIKFLGVGVPL